MDALHFNWRKVDIGRFSAVDVWIVLKDSFKSKYSLSLGHVRIIFPDN